MTSLSVWAKVSAHMLAMAGDEFGNHGCNDLNLDELFLTKEEQIIIITFMGEQNGDPENTPERIKRLPYTTDFCVMFACASWLRMIAKRGSV